MVSDETIAVVFDLDACCWSPEMYQLWGGGAPFTQQSTTPNNTLKDSRGTTVRLLGDVASCWAECHTRMQAGEPLILGVASRSDEPSWAREVTTSLFARPHPQPQTHPRPHTASLRTVTPQCLRKFIVKPGVCMMDVVTENLCEIYKGSKRDHFKALHAKTGVPFSRMCFFDDDMSNIRDVGGLGVHCVYTPDGTTRKLFEQGVGAARAAAGAKPPSSAALPPGDAARRADPS